MTIAVTLRPVREADFSVLIEHQRDAVSARMAAFGTQDTDAEALAARWSRHAADPSITMRAILVDDRVVGFAATFLRDGKPEVTYWIARAEWGRGIATAALSALLRIVTLRPIHASAAKDNVGSLRVLEKCGFVVRGSGRAFSPWRGEEIEEVFLDLR